MSGLLVVFAKAPRAGQVKTRLCPPFTSEEAATFYAHMLDDVLTATAKSAPALGLEAWVAVHPAEACPELARQAPGGLRFVAQRGATLPQRMAWAVAEGAATGASPIVLRGSDSPALSEATLGSALEALEQAELVVCPDLDGGYNLIGLRRPVPGLFDHPMSTSSVLQDTLANAKAAGLSAAVLEPGFDIDTAADLRWLAEARDRGENLPCPRTLAFLDECDLWRHACPPRSAQGRILPAHGVARR